MFSYSVFIVFPSQQALPADEQNYTGGGVGWQVLFTNPSDLLPNACSPYPSPQTLSEALTARLMGIHDQPANHLSDLRNHRIA